MDSKTTLNKSTDIVSEIGFNEEESFEFQNSIVPRESNLTLGDQSSLKRHVSEPLRKPNLVIDTDLLRSNSVRGTLLPYNTTPYFSRSTQDLQNIDPDVVNLTVINSLNTPTVLPKSAMSLWAKESPRKGMIKEPNLFRAFGRLALSQQRHRWMCPFMMIILSFILKVLITSLTYKGSTENYLYCSNFDSSNQQNWPIYNISGTGIRMAGVNSFPGAKKPIKGVNFLDRLKFVDLSTGDPISQLSAATVAGALPCVQWFGQQYPTSSQEIYEKNVKPLNGYSTKDSLYSSEILSGWLDVLAPTKGGTELNDPYARQALSLVRTFVGYQTRPWAIVGHSMMVNQSDIGAAPRESALVQPSDMPSGIPFFKSADDSNGILDTIEPRYFVVGSSVPPKLTGYQKVPFFNVSFGSPAELTQYIFSSVQSAVINLSQIGPVDGGFAAVSSDLTVAQIVLNLQKAIEDVPYGSIYFDKIDHLSKQYDYTLQFAANKVLDGVPGFPNPGFRRLIQQSQLSNGLLRFSNSSLSNTVITQGTRAFPFLENPGIQIPYGGYIGRILYPLGISFLVPIFVVSLVADKERKILGMLRMNGLGDVTGYYLTSYLTFFLNYCVAAFVFLITGYFTRLDLFSQTSTSVLFAVFVVWGHVQTSLTFLLASLFNRASVATIGAFMVVICSVITSFMLEQVFSDPLTFPRVLYIWPPFVFYRLLGILNHHASSNILPVMVINQNYQLHMLVLGDVVLEGLIIMILQTVAMLAISIYTTQVIPSVSGTSRPWHYLIPFIFKDVIPKSSLPVECIDDFEDADVKEERERVSIGYYSHEAPLIIKDVCKNYHSNSKMKAAITNVTFSVDKGIVFGLLGPNGAGKTSLISILTGINEATSGQASIAGYDLKTQTGQALRSIGVCPQFDILWEDLSVEDHLYFYARLKGIDITFENEAVYAALDLVRLVDLRFRIVKGLSGGEKRRVSIAIALVSNPKVTGLDPEVRRTVWDTIARARQSRAILMTTHSMEEAEVCCQKIGIMSKGQLRCLGTTARLKYLYGVGYKLQISSENMERAERYILGILPVGSRRLHAFQNNRRYGFVPEKEQLATIFDELVANGRSSGIDGWGISQTTLDEIFTSVVSENDAAGQ